MSRTRKLDAIEQRVLGALMEKEQTTPDHYPLTTKAVMAACNQKSNRDPVMQLSETEVTEALDRLQKDVLVWRSDGARSERWQHSLDRRWELTRGKKAVMTLLLLRGPQTPGELRSRSERMHGFSSVGEVEATLSELAEGFDAMVCELSRRPGQREARWMHLESASGDPRETAAEEPSGPTAAEAEAARAATVEAAQAEAEKRRAYDERLEALEETVAELRGVVGDLREQVSDLRRELGVE